jgi:tRNA threonylcarbamoyl adenosine modification protein (Sua5/YciO/YrdC/YwlC family)
MPIEVQKIDSYKVDQKQIIRAVEILEKGGVIVYPTDTIYGLAADILNKEAVSKIFKIKKLSTQKLLSLIFSDFKEIANWAFIPNNAYRIMKRVLPGKYTFILPASKEVPKALLHLQKRKTMGVRVPDAEIAHSLVKSLGRPLLSTSVPKGPDGFFTNPSEIVDQYQYDVDMLLDGGITPNIPSTVIDFTVSPPEILREGAGEIDILMG